MKHIYYHTQPPIQSGSANATQQSSIILTQKPLPQNQSGSHALPSPTIQQQPQNAVNQPIIPPQNKTVIGLHQAPQILMGAVASPPLKAHSLSQQPIVTGKLSCGHPKALHLLIDTFTSSGASSSRVSIPSISPQELQLQHPPRGLIIAGAHYEGGALVS